MWTGVRCTEVGAVSLEKLRLIMNLESNKQTLECSHVWCGGGEHDRKRR